MIPMRDKELEQTLVLIKPDALKNSLTGYVLSLLSQYHTGLRFAGAKIVQVSRMLAEEHYDEHRTKPFFASLLDYITGRIHYPLEPGKRRVVAFVYQGPGATEKVREVVGPTNPHVAREQMPGCIRALGTVVPIKDEAGHLISERMENLIHASADDREAEREIKLWFKPNDIPPSMHAYPTAASDGHFYVKNNVLLAAYEPGSTCLLTPGEVAWKSDLDALRLLARGLPSPVSLPRVTAKCLINARQEE